MDALTWAKRCLNLFFIFGKEDVQRLVIGFSIFYLHLRLSGLSASSVRGQIRAKPSRILAPLLSADGTVRRKGRHKPPQTRSLGK